MNILVLSSDPSIARQGSPAQNRMRFYARAPDATHIVVINGLGSFQRYDSLYIYPTGQGWRLLALLHAYRMAKRICKKATIDVISAQGPDESGLIAWFLSHRLGIPWHIQIHTDVMSPWYRHASWKEQIRYRMARFLIPRADCIRVVSERIKKSLTESGILNLESRITVLPVYMDLSKFLNAEPDRADSERFKNYPFKMIAAGRFVDKEKNFSMLIDVMQEFIKICPDALLVIAGDGPDRKNYELRIMNYELQKNVILEPWRNNLHIFYRSFDLFLCSSHYEGWGVAVLEAMAAGLPVVMTDVGLAGEVVKDRINGRVVPVNDTRHFVKAITEFYNNVELMTELALRGIKTVQNISHQNKKEYLERYKKSFCIIRQQSIQK